MTTTTIYLHGRLRRDFGGPFTLAVDTPAEAVRALGCQLKGFAYAIRQGSYRIVRGSQRKGTHLDAEQLELSLSGNALHLIPAAAGRGSGDNGATIKIVAGVALAVVSFGVGAIAAGGVSGALGAGFSIAGAEITAGMFVAMGVSIALSGVAMAMAPSPPGPGEQGKPADERKSYLFNGPVNSQQQGESIPVVYGRAIVGSIVISAGLDTEEVPV